ncbi:MAG: hypothetical protein NT067_07400 [Candidatus Diapherotrites archaeon]|nr:hypothetical protein [Candidatus Diapherotrites archaeon]
MLAMALGLFFFAIVCFALGELFFSLLFFLGGAFILAGTFIYRAGKYSGEKIKKSASKVYSDMDKANPTYPSKAVIGEGLNVLGKKAGDDLWEQKKVWAMETKKTGIRERVGSAAKTFIAKFMGIFK